MSNLSSLRLLGLDPSSFRVVHDDEMDPNHDADAHHHADGSVCRCEAECVEWMEAHWWPVVDAHKIPH